MKKSIVLVFIIVLLSYSMVFAQVEGAKFAINWGVNAPLAPQAFETFWKPTFANVGFGAGFDINENVEILGMFEWQKFTFNRTRGFPVEDVGPVDRIANITTYSGTLNIKYKMDLPFHRDLGSYFLVGGGAMRLIPSSIVRLSEQIDFDDLRSNPIADKDLFLFENNKSWYATGNKEMVPTGQIGFGFSLAQEGGSLTLDVRYVAAFTDEDMTTFLPIKLTYIFQID